MRLDLHASPEEVMRAVEALQKFAQARGLPEKALFGLSLALEECGSNIVHHALRDDPRQRFQVTFLADHASITIELRDRGPEFDPTTVAGGAPQASEGDPPGGWGIQLVRRYLDEIHYRRDGNENVLRLTKRLSGSEPK